MKMIETTLQPTPPQHECRALQSDTAQSPGSPSPIHGAQFSRPGIYPRRAFPGSFILLCLLAACWLAGCTAPIQPVQPTASLTALPGASPTAALPLPAGLSIEEHALQFAPTGEPLTFRPVNGSMQEILALHKEARDRETLLARRNNRLLAPFGYELVIQTFPYQLLKNGEKFLEFYTFGRVTLNTAGDDFILPLYTTQGNNIIRKETVEKVAYAGGGAYAAFLGDRILQVSATLLDQESATPDPDSPALWYWIAQVTLDQDVVYTTTFQSPVAVAGIWGLWSYAGHWALETYGSVIQDGVSLNAQYGYDQTFGFQLLNDKPFFFYQKGQKIGVVYDGQEIHLNYDWLPHYGCCSAGEFNPRPSENMISFFARRSGVYYYVEIGVFTPQP